MADIGVWKAVLNRVFKQDAVVRQRRFFENSQQAGQFRRLSDARGGGGSQGTEWNRG